jgi:uncharacterized protein YbjT (DUF2867 family)
VDFASGSHSTVYFPDLPVLLVTHDFGDAAVLCAAKGPFVAATPAPLSGTAGQRHAAQLATGELRGGTIDLAGPEPQDLVDMARRTLAARGETIRLIPTWRGPLRVEVAGEVLLPGSDAQLAATTFDDWLATQALTEESTTVP